MYCYVVKYFPPSEGVSEITFGSICSRSLWIGVSLANGFLVTGYAPGWRHPRFRLQKAFGLERDIWQSCWFILQSSDLLFWRQFNSIGRRLFPFAVFEYFKNCHKLYQSDMFHISIILDWRNMKNSNYLITISIANVHSNL